jgi:predicted PurR-regulated permease PerM
MLGIDRSAARYTFTATVVLVALWVVYEIRLTLFVFVLAVLFAYLLSPLVNALDRALPSRTRTPALALAYVIFICIVGAAGYEIGSKVVEQATVLAKDLPTQIEKWKSAPNGGNGLVDRYKIQVIEYIQSEVARNTNDIVSAIPAAGAKFLAIASNLIYVVIIPILAFFFLKNGHEIRSQIVSFVEDSPQRKLLDEVFADLDLLLAQYMRALLILSLATLVFYSGFFFIAGVPYAILLGTLAAVLEIIPMLGPLVAVVVIMLVAVLTGSHALAVLIFILCYRMFQDYVLSPHLMGKGVELHPLIVLFGVFAGAELAGIPGTFLSVPILALVRILYLRIRKARIATTPLAET